MKKTITKKKISISLDIDIYNTLESICEQTDSKMSTKINNILKRNREIWQNDK